METVKFDNDNLSKIPEIAKLISYVLFLSILLGVVEAEIYFQLFLHIPIFQYMDATEVVLFSPGTGVTLLVYYLGIVVAGYFLKEPNLYWFTKLVAILATLVVWGLFFKIAYNNDPVIHEMIVLPLHYWWYLILVVFFTFAFGEYFPGTKQFIDKHKQFRPILLTFWYGLVVGYLNYYVLIENHRNVNVIVKLKSGIQVSTNNKLIYAGRTKNYWFFYDRQSKFTRVIKDEDVRIADFNSVNGK